MADRKITQLTALLYAAMANNDLLAGVDVSADETVKITLEDIAKFVLGNRAIGTNVATAITTNNGSQTLTNKRLNNPQINSNTLITANGTEINKLAGMTATTAELNKLSGMTASKAELNHVTGSTSNIQQQIDGIISVIPMATQVVHRYSLGFEAAGTSKEITQEEILAGAGISSSLYVIDHTSIVASIYEVSGNRMDALSPQTISVASKSVTGQIQLEKVGINPTTPSTNYMIVVYFTIKNKTGV